jgi:NADH-quinone oxidoreductase subunit C
MTVALSGLEVAKQISTQFPGAKFPGAITESSNQTVIIKSEYLLQVLEYLKNSPDFMLNYLADLTSVDNYDYFEVVYQLTSGKNHRLTVKTCCYNHERPVLPSVTSLWRGADFMEREVYDLMGIAFAGHPNLKRIVLWEGFNGHPLRKDYHGNGNSPQN